MSDREAFENWYADHTGDAHIRLYCESLGRYQFNAMQSAWEAWQAAQQDQSQPSELEMHRADYNAIKKAGFESPGELLAAWQAAKAEQQPEEPVAYVYHTPGGAREVSWFGVDDIEDDALLYTHPAPAQPQVAEGWRDIASAPRDGTRIILSWGGESVTGFFLDNSASNMPWAGWRTDSLRPTPKDQPCAWQPFPAPLTASQEQESP